HARAQAKHRAKVKAYVEQASESRSGILERTVAKLQIAYGSTREYPDTLAPPLKEIRALEQENFRLEEENDILR
ncbi:hypothetical protein B0H13DRAFT_1528416, partial [Mycena leptocephala]